jgi:uncharacterized coiled-coil DUF342 family protein
MNNYNEKLIEINAQIKEMNETLENMEKEILDNEKYLGLITLVEDRLNLQLLLSEELFNEDDMKELTDIVNQLQELIVKVCEGGNKDE